MVTHITISPAPNSLKKKRLLQLAKQHGATWEVLAGPEPMQCFNNQLGLRIRSLDGAHERNVAVTDVKRDWE